MLNTKQIEILAEKLADTRRIAIVTHSNPDGDAIGSSLALALALRKNGKDASVIIPDGLPDFLRWLPGIELSTTYAYRREQAEELLGSAGMIFCLDFNELKRTGEMAAYLETTDAFRVLVDHHEDPDSFCDLQISESWRASVGEMVYHLIRELLPAGTLDRDMATCLYTAIMTDTGNFSFASSYPEIFHTAADLMELGIDKDGIFSRVYDAFSESRLRLQGYCMSEKLVYLPDYSTAYISLSGEELKRFGHRKGDTEGFVNIPFSIKGVRFTAMFIEKPDRVKISFRSRGSFPANSFARKHFNGGGHLNAAGGESFRTLEESLADFESLLPNFEEQLRDEV